MLLEINMYKTHREYILEGQEGKNFKKARRFLETKGFNYQESMAIFGPLKQQIPNLRKNDSKFTLGVVRILCEKNLLNKDGVSDTTGDTLAEIDGILGAIEVENEVDKFDEDLNGYTLDELKEQFNEKIAHADVQSRNELETQYGSNNDGSYNGYTIVRIDSFEDGNKPEYYDYCSWCILTDERLYNNYTNNSRNLFYILLNDYYETTEEIKGDNYPLDEYGLSMIAVSVDMKGNLNSCTCRWNNNNDNVMNVQQISSLIGANFYSVFKPRSEADCKKAQRKSRDTMYEYFKQDMVEKNNDIERVCQPIIPIGSQKYTGELYYRYCNEIGCIVLNEKGNIVCNEVFYNIAFVYENFIPVHNQSNRINFLNPKTGNLIGDTWYKRYSMEKTNTFGNLIEVFIDNEKSNYICPNGELLFTNFGISYSLNIGDRTNIFASEEDNDEIYLFNVNKGQKVTEKPLKRVDYFNEQLLVLTRKDDKCILYGEQYEIAEVSSRVKFLSGRSTKLESKSLLFEVITIENNLHCWMDRVFELYDLETREPIDSEGNLIEFNESITHHKSTKRITERILSKLKTR